MIHTTRASVRNLMYRVYPAAGSGSDKWRWNVRQIQERWSLFNGKRIIAIVVDDDASRKLERPGAVKHLFSQRGYRCEFITVQDLHRLGEVTTFLPMLETLYHRDGMEHVTFYGHTKGVGRSMYPGSPVQLWTEWLYELNLDYWPVVANRLRRCPVVGAIKSVGHYSEGSAVSDWNYPGSFFWFRNKDVFARDWRAIEPFYWGVESYPSLHFGIEEAGVIAVQGDAFKELSLYEPDYVGLKVEAWKRKHIRVRRQGNTV